MLKHSTILLSFLFTICDGFGISCRPRISSKLSASSESLPLRNGDSKIALDSELEEFCKTAEMAARSAGEIILKNLGCASDMGKRDQDEECEIKTNIKDIVTQYDKQAQDTVESIIREAYPSHSFLGEEDVNPGAAASEAALQTALKNSDDYLWILDPIDGTANFASGLALCGVTVTVVFQGVAVVGVVYDPHADEMFSAIRGQGFASLNGKPLPNLQNHGVQSMKDAIINAGCPADANAFQTSVKGITALNSQSRGIRMIACSALTTAWIAAGRLTAHFGYDLSSWDLAAGQLLISESGGCVTDLDGSPYKLETRNMLCSINSKVHDEILNTLTDADAVAFSRSQQ